MTAIPHSTVAAVLDKEAGALVVRDIPVASIYEDEILIAAKACSVKAVDNYHIDYSWAPDGSVFGTRVSGYVVKVGESVTRFKPGDYVASFIHGGDFTSPAKGAYSKLAITQEIYSIKLDHLEQSTIDHIPYGKVTYEGVSELVGTLVTIGIFLYKTLGGSFENPQDLSS